MFCAAVLHYFRFAKHFFWASVLVVTNACVTTTTGGFNVEPSDEESLEDNIQLAVSYLDADDMPNARRQLSRTLEIDSRNSEAFEILVLVSLHEGDLELAIENFQRAMCLDQSNSRAQNNFAALLRSQRCDSPGARTALRQYLKSTDFYSLSLTPRDYLAGITIQSRFNNQKLVDDFTRIPTNRYQDPREYAELKQRMTDAN